MRGGENNGRRKGEGDPPDQNGQPQAGKPEAEDQLAGVVQTCDAESMGNRSGGVPERDFECDPGGDYLYPAGGTNLKGGEGNA